MKKIIATLSLLLIFTTGFNQAFVSIWKTGTSNYITIPGYGKNYNIQWEEVGNPSHNGSLLGTNTTVVNFGDTGTYKISISGGNPAFNRINFGKIYGGYPANGFVENGITSVLQWGNINWERMDSAFYFCRFLTSVPNTTPSIFIGTLSHMFHGCKEFNANISNWNISIIYDLSYVFYECYKFNQPLGNWNTSNVTNMESLFWHCSNFNQSLNSWNTSNVINMSQMFALCTFFNQPLNSWNTSNVKYTYGLFYGANDFNQPLNNWDMSNVIDMQQMFGDAHSFNQPLNNWDVSNVINMSAVFAGAISFNQPLNNWDVSNVKYMWQMFAEAYSFNQPLNNWNTSNVEKMFNLFDNAIVFNQNIGSWNIEKIDTVDLWFFHESIGLSNCGLNVDNYDSTIIAWSTQNVKKGVLVNAQGLKYCASRERRDSLKLNKNWKFIGDTVSGDETCLPLFVKFSSFTATPQQSKVLLQWQTATETNNNFFTVQRSNNKDNWQDIATIKGAGNSSVAKEYSSTDDNPLQGTSYYRIKQTDFNGIYSYSEMRSVELGIRNLGISIYPNPAKDFVNITTNQSLWLSVYDMFGKTVLTQKLNAGDNRVNTNNLSNGLYLIEAKGTNATYTTKLLISK